MNYIKQLEQERSELQERVISMLDKITEFEVHMQTSKFYHPDDYIQTSDVYRWLSYISCVK